MSSPAASGAASGSGTGKVIVLGEHAVVHGEPAIVLGLSRGVRVTLVSAVPESPGGQPESAPERALAKAAQVLGVPAPKGVVVRVEGDLPVAVGLGSSAALSVATVRALAAHVGLSPSDDDVAGFANEIERLFHGTPSGVDATAAAHGGLRWFEAGPPRRHEPVAAPAPLPLVVALSGSRHDTGRSVLGLRDRARAAREIYAPVFSAIGALVRAGRTAIEAGDAPRLGEILTMNHGLLRACGVSTPELDRLVDVALREGALGAKLTGAGGGGAAIALASGEPGELAERLSRSGWESFPVA
ncbi:MAG: mevalonate kinase [Deltaproteobacteria bacterium]|nr:mevalonate kinase [Deltaproteobacteria bacterium]